MKTFTDSQGRTWNVVLNVGALRRVRDLLKVDLLDVARGDLLERLADDPVLLVDVLYVLCKTDAEAQGVSDEDFGRAMVGGVLDEAGSALMQELLGFFPSAQRARALGKLMRMLDAREAELATLGGSSGGSPASAAATPQG